MGAKRWSPEELSDLRNGMRISAFVKKWGRSREAVYNKRTKMNIKVGVEQCEAAPRCIHPEHTQEAAAAVIQKPVTREYRPVPDAPSKPLREPRCSYCSGFASKPCTCHLKSKCDDPLCAYYPS